MIFGKTDFQICASLKTYASGLASLNLRFSSSEPKGFSREREVNMQSQ
jgi:hypothetical protein